MKWFRANIRAGSRLALFALAIQFLLSFGHFHVDRAQAASTSAEATRSTLHDSVAFPIVQANKAPADHAPLGQLGDECAICAVVALANATVMALPPCVAAPEASTLLYLVGDPGRIDLNSVRVAFQPRGPPTA
jgi:hypothetical protein